MKENSAPSLQRQHLASIVGANIAALRALRGWTQTQLAEKLDMGPDSLSRMERGLVAPRFARLERIADALACTVAELFYTAEDRARMLAPAGTTTQTRHSLPESPATAYASGIIPTAAAKKSYELPDVEEMLFMTERIAALLRQ